MPNLQDRFLQAALAPLEGLSSPILLTHRGLSAFHLRVWKSDPMGRRRTPSDDWLRMMVATGVVKSRERELRIRFEGAREEARWTRVGRIFDPCSVRNLWIPLQFSHETDWFKSRHFRPQLFPDEHCRSLSRRPR